ncbi:MAG TPA: DUF2189 domain-containing protein [Aromatoleum sp.]|uniref:DUF2189 domain-containing protein n=1 Tax=Aromatoleum sp. TaxID=2307007 RepID=UPI002B468A3E|nr:DUF2189 domain-containing protein [Aromatoleum sp.]HJV27132.1 DUF2189 domain-containing protein [Aromatoleum sp.]
MDKPLNSLDRHFHLPDVRRVEADRPLMWLRMGWNDMRSSPAASLGYGALAAVIGYLILAYAARMPYLFVAAMSGFFLVGPLVAAGLYEISRRNERGETVSFMESLKGLQRHGDHLAYYGAFLAFALIGWERLSAILFALFYHETASPDLANFFQDVFLSGNYVQFVVSYLVIGAAIAGLIFVLSVVSVPMMIDRDADIATAMMSSVRAVGHNPDAMAVWAVLIVALIGVGFATMMIGMVVLLPLVGHATWHAYKDLIE